MIANRTRGWCLRSAGVGAARSLPARTDPGCGWRVRDEHRRAYGAAAARIGSMSSAYGGSRKTMSKATPKCIAEAVARGTGDGLGPAQGDRRTRQPEHPGRCRAAPSPPTGRTRRTAAAAPRAKAIPARPRPMPAYRSSTRQPGEPPCRAALPASRPAPRAPARRSGRTTRPAGTVNAAAAGAAADDAGHRRGHPFSR